MQSIGVGGEQEGRPACDSERSKLILSTLPVSRLAVSALAFTCHFNLLPVQASLKDGSPASMQRVLSGGLTFCALLYATVAASGESSALGARCRLLPNAACPVALSKPRPCFTHASPPPPSTLSTLSRLPPLRFRHRRRRAEEPDSGGGGPAGAAGRCRSSCLLCGGRVCVQPAGQLCP